MTGMDADHFGVVNACLRGEGAVDDQTLTSVAILQERMARLKQTHGLLAGLSFSPQVEQLYRCPTTSVVG